MLMNIWFKKFSNKKLSGIKGLNLVSKREKPFEEKSIKLHNEIIIRF